MAEIYSSSPIYNIGSEEIKYQTTGDNGPVYNGQNRVRYFDYDGSLLKIEYVPTGGETIPPENPNPDPDYLIFHGWNHDTTEQVTYPLDIGALYDTVGDKVYIWIDVNSYFNSSPFFQLNLFTNVASIDWGDGTIQTSIKSGVMPYHSYNSFGKYLIIVSPRDNTTLMSGNTNYALGSSDNSNYMIEKVYLPKCFKINSAGDGLFNYCNYLKYAVLPATYVGTPPSIAYRLCRYCYNLKHINIPQYITGLNQSFETCYTLQTISLPKSITIVDNFRYTYSLKEIILHSPTQIVNNCFNQSGIEYFYFDCKNGINTIEQNTFSNAATLGTKNTLVIPEGITTLSSGAFSYAGKFYDCVIWPSTLQDMYAPFCNATIKNIIIKSSSIPNNTNTYSSQLFSTVVNIWVKDELVDSYKTTAPWSNYADRIKPLSQYEGDY